jgi:hypothetical protein
VKRSRFLGLDSKFALQLVPLGADFVAGVREAPRLVLLGLKFGFMAAVQRNNLKISIFL